MARRRLTLGWMAVVLATGWLAGLSAAQTNAPAPAPGSAVRDDAEWFRNVAQTYQGYLQQQQATLHAIEQTHQDAAAAAKRNALETDARLQRIEAALDAQRDHELATLQGAHRFTMITAGAFAGVGFFGMLFFALFVIRSMNRRVDLIAAQAAGGLRPFGAGYAGVLGSGETQMVSVNPAAQSTGRFLSALEQLEKRIQEMEHTAEAPAAGAEPAARAAAAPAAEPAAELPARDDKPARIALLLGKGEALLNLQQADTAIVCFDEVIALDPTWADAFVKKGTALERLGRIDEAIDNYDRAIALDDSLTMAYLCKGGVFNRLERYGEALQCYEQALRTQEKSRLG